MKYTKCVGINTEKVPFPEFMDMFTQECLFVGDIVTIKFAPNYAAAVVIKNDN